MARQGEIRELGVLVGPGLSDLVPVKRRALVLSSELPVRADIDLYPDPTPWDADVHQEFEFGIVLEGREERRLGLPAPPRGGLASPDDLFGPGDVWLGAMWEPHWWRAISAGTLDVYIQFTADYLGAERVGKYCWFELFAPARRGRPRVASPALRETVLSLGQRIREELAQRREGWEQAIRLDALRVLVELARYRDPPGPSAVARQKRARDTDLHAIMPALARLNSRLPSRLSLGEAAKECGISQALFCLIFKRSMGITFAQFALRARLAWVSDRLLLGDEPIAAIAATAGFTDESHLHRTFVKHYGQTPGFYRRFHGGAESERQTSSR
jgi:AraC-like DNA-binding protein